MRKPLRLQSLFGAAHAHADCAPDTSERAHALPQGYFEPQESFSRESIQPAPTERVLPRGQQSAARVKSAPAPTCGHAHIPHLPAAGQGRSFAIAVGLNLSIVLIQALYGFFAHSTALLADAGHNFFDALGLILAWGAVHLSQRVPNKRYTFGLGATSILASLANATLLLLACGAIAWESIARLQHPEPVSGLTVFVVALVGLVANGFCAFLFSRGNHADHSDLNLRAAFLHMLSDAAVSGAVALSGIAILFTGWMWLDSALSLVVVAVILWSTWSVLAESVRLALGAVPARVDCAGIERYFMRLPGVHAFHDLHIWGLSTTQSSLSVHLVMPGGHPGDAFLDSISQELLDHHHIEHATFQICLGAREHPCSVRAPRPR